jgi:Ca-activated chloride channel family protein
MKQRKFNVLLLLFGLLGAVVGFIIGELILHKLVGHWPHIVVIGLYFGIMALCIGLGGHVVRGGSTVGTGLSG